MELKQLEGFSKLESVEARTTEEFQKTFDFKRMSACDLIYIKYGTKLTELFAGMHKFNLENDPDVIQCIADGEQKYQQKVEKLEKARKDLRALTYEFKKSILAACGLLKIPKEDVHNGFLITTFLSIEIYVTKFSFEWIYPFLKEHRKERRTVIGNEEKYTQIVDEFQAWEKKIKHEIITLIANEVGFDTEKYYRSFNFYQTNNEYRPALLDAINETKFKVLELFPKPKPISKGKLIEMLLILERNQIKNLEKLKDAMIKGEIALTKIQTFYNK